MKRLFAALCLMMFAATAALATDGAGLYKSACAGCHGADGSKKAGNGAPLKTLGADETLERLKAYAEDPKYGGEHKTVMQGVVKKHSQEELQAIADHIGTLQ